METKQPERRSVADTQALALWERWQASGFSALAIDDARGVVARLGQGVATVATQKGKGVKENG